MLRHWTAGALCVLTLVSSRADLTTVDWGSQYAFSGLGAPDILYTNGLGIPTNSTWAVQIVRTNGTWTNDFQVVLPGTPVFTNTPTVFWGSVEVNGVGLQQVSQPWASSLNGVVVFTRFFNNANPAQATMVADVATNKLTWTPTAPPSPPPRITYNIGTVSSSAWYRVTPLTPAPLFPPGSGVSVDPVTGQAAITFAVTNGYAYRIVYKDDLLSTNAWQPVPPGGWLTATSTALLTITDPGATNRPRRFYRLEAR